MRKLLVITIVLASLWGGYWFVGSSATERGLASWIDARQQDGWMAEYTDLSTHGFPNRFDTTITGLELADPNTGVAWSAPFFQILSLSYQPHHVIAVWPATQTIATPEQKIDIESELMRGSIVFDPGTSIALNRSSVEMTDIALSSSLGWQSHLQSGQLATRQTVGRPNTYDVNFQAHGLTPGAQFIQSLNAGDLLPGVFDGMSIDATLEFDAPWDRFAIERARPQITSVELKILKANWGDLDLWMAGTLNVDAQGVPSGEITVKAKNWREMVEVARAAGFLPDMLVPTVQGALQFLAGLSGDPTTLDAPLTVKNGIVSLGPFPIGPAPNLTLH